MKEEPESLLNKIIKNQKPSLLVRFVRLLATPFVGIYNSIKSAIKGNQEIPSNPVNHNEYKDGCLEAKYPNPLVAVGGSTQEKLRSDEKSEGKTSNELEEEEKIDTPSLAVPELSERETSGFLQTFKRFVTKFFSARAKESATVYHNAKSVSALDNGDYVSFDTEIDYPPLNRQPLSAEPFQERMCTPPTSATQEQPNSSVDSINTEHTQNTQGKKPEGNFTFYI